MTLTPSIVGRTDRGKARARNEDSVYLLPGSGIAVVADGMGGHPGGNVASRIAAEALPEAFQRELARKNDGGADLREAYLGAMRYAVQEAHSAIRAEGRETPELDGMGTTVTAVAMEPGSGRFVVGHVGDSRAYLFRDGALDQITRDDTWVQDRVETFQLTPEQARRHPFSHLLTQCLGLEKPPTPEIQHGELNAGDAILLCTDGLVGMLDDERIALVLEQSLDPADGGAGAVDALVDAANEAGGLDNITTAIVLLGSG